MCTASPTLTCTHGFIRAGGLLSRWWFFFSEKKTKKLGSFCPLLQPERGWQEIVIDISARVILLSHLLILRLQALILLSESQMPLCTQVLNHVHHTQTLQRERYPLPACSKSYDLKCCHACCSAGVELGEQPVGSCGWCIQSWPAARLDNDCNWGSLLYIALLFSHEEEWSGIWHSAGLWLHASTVGDVVRQWLSTCAKEAERLCPLVELHWDPPICTGASWHQLVKVCVRAWLWTSVCLCSDCTSVCSCTVGEGLRINCLQR